MPRVIHFDLMSEQPDKLAEFCIKAWLERTEVGRPDGVLARRYR